MRKRGHFYLCTTGARRPRFTFPHGRATLILYEHPDDQERPRRTGLPGPRGPGAIGSIRARSPSARRARSRSTSPAANTTWPPTWPTASGCGPASPRPWSTTASASWCKRASARRASRRSTSGSSTTASAARTSPPSTATAATASARRSSSTTAPTRPAALLKPGDFDWAEDLRPRRALVPLAAASSPRCPQTTSELILEGMQAAQGRRRGHLVRPELSRQALGRPSAATPRGQEVIRRIAANVDVLLRQRGRPAKGPGHLAGPEVARASRSSTRPPSSS